METFSALLVICGRIHRLPVDSPHKGQVAWNFGVFLGVRQSKQSAFFPQEGLGLGLGLADYGDCSYRARTTPLG